MSASDPSRPAGRRRGRGAGADGKPDPLETGLETPGTEEVAVVPWPLLWQRRAQARVERSDRYPWIVLVAALWGLFSIGFSITVLTIAIPTIAADLDSSRDILIWVVTGPILLGAIVTPSAGKLADVFGARRVYLVAMLFVALFAGLAAIAWSAASLIAFRVLGAAIGSATGPASIAIINRLFPRERRAQALGYWSLVAAFGPVLGVVIGGPIVEAVSWRWIFIAQVPLTLLTVLVCAAVFPDTERDPSVRFDIVGAVLLALGVGSFVVALNRAPAEGWGWTNPFVLTGFALGPIALGAFFVYERRIEHQLVPTRYFRQRNFAFPMANQFFANFTYMGGFYLTPLLLHDVLGYSPSKIGFISIARPLVFSIAGPLAGYAATRVGERVNGVLGGLFLLASMVLFAQVGASTGELLIIAALALSGAGMGTTSPAMAAAVANSVDERDLGVVGGAQQMVSQVGVVVGTQLMVTVVQMRTASVGVTEAYADGYLVGGVAALLALAAASAVRSTVGRSAPVASPGVGGPGVGDPAPVAAGR